MKNSKLIRYLLILFLLCPFAMHAQVFRATKISDRSAGLLKTFKHAEVFRLKSEAIDSYKRNTKNGSPVTLIFGDEVINWKLYEHDMMRTESRVTTMENGKKVNLPFDKSCKTFIGYRNDMEKSARFIISGQNFAAMIPRGNTYMFIQPLHDFIKGSEPDLFVLYYPADLLAVPGATCSIIPEKVRTDPGQENEIFKQNPQRSQRTYNCRELQVTIANDSRMHMHFGTVADEINFNLTVLFFMEPYYDDFDLDFWVEEIFSVTSNSNSDNPWGPSTEVDELQVAFGDWAYNGFGSEDIGNLWTTGDLHDDDDYGTVGYASVGGACSDIGLYPWAILEDFNSTNFYLLSILQAHEYGHLLDADHEPGTGTIMEPSLAAVETTSWAQANIDEMFSFMADETCIQSCVHCPVFYNIIDYIGWGDWHYSALDHISSSAVIDSFADVVFQANNYIKFMPGFNASAIRPSTANGTFIAKIDGCE